ARHAVAGVVVDQDRMHTVRIGKLLDDWNQVEVTIGDVKGDDSVRLDMLAIDRKRFRSEQVYRYGIAGKCVDRQHVEGLRRVAFERQTGVSERSLDLRVAVLEIGEVAIGDLDDRRVDVIEMIDVALASVGRQGSGSQTDDSDPDGLSPWMQGLEDAADSRCLSVIRRRAHRQLRRVELSAVKDRPVDKRAVP